MRNRIVTVALLVCVAVPLSAEAEGLTPTPVQSLTNTPSSSLRNEFSQLLQKFGISLISKAYGEECRQEGETCSFDKQCCADLECTGGPPATCRPKD